MTLCGTTRGLPGRVLTDRFGDRWTILSSGRLAGRVPPASPLVRDLVLLERDFGPLR